MYTVPRGPLATWRPLSVCLGASWPSSIQRQTPALQRRPNAPFQRPAVERCSGWQSNWKGKSPPLLGPFSAGPKGNLSFVQAGRHANTRIPVANFITHAFLPPQSGVRRAALARSGLREHSSAPTELSRPKERALFSSFFYSALSLSLIAWPTSRALPSPTATGSVFNEGTNKQASQRAEQAGNCAPPAPLLSSLTHERLFLSSSCHTGRRAPCNFRRAIPLWPPLHQARPTTSSSAARLPKQYEPSEAADQI